MRADSVTQLGVSARGTVAICASHGGRYPAAVAARLGVRGVVFNDAAVGRDGAGIAGLELLERAGIAGVAVGHDSARIGDVADTCARGVVSFVNELAARAGCAPGMPALRAAEMMAVAEPVPGQAPVDPDEARHLVHEGPPPVWALDSAALAVPDDAGAVLVTGSHGGLLGGRASTALKADALGAVFNDAGGGIEGAGMARLSVLDDRDIPAATVAAASARIGDGRSTYADGVLSAVNESGRAIGAVPGQAARDFVDLVLRKQPKRSKDR